MYTYLATALISAALAASGTYKIQQWKFDSKEKDRAEQELSNVRLSAATAVRRIDTVSQAQSAAAIRSDVLRRSADASRTALDGLRESSTSALRAAATSLDASTATIATYDRLLGQCGREYQELGAVADRHSSDIRTMIAAWPTTPKDK